MHQNTSVQELELNYVELTKSPAQEKLNYHEEVVEEVINVDKQKVKAYLAQVYFVAVVVLTFILLF